MGPIGMPEMIMIFVVILLLFGAKKLPELARGIGKSMGEFKKARDDFEKAKASPHKEIQAALLQIRAKFRKGTFTRSTLTDLTWSWRGRVLNDTSTRASFAALEDALIRRLAVKAHTKPDLIHFLWGHSINPESADFRFKRLLQRIRKKHPGLIHYKDGMYSLAQHSSIRFPKIRREKAA